MRFTKEHEYARVEAGVATCGITDFAQSALGDVVFVSLPAVGAAVKKGEAFAGVESVKAASDVYAPVSGKVVEANAAIVAEPALVNSGAESAAWFVKVKLDNEAELKGMMDQAAYDAFCKASKH